MNVYDFDGTIYNGDSSIDFYRFVLKRYPVILKRLPKFIIKAIRYKSGKCSTKELKECFFSFLNDIPDIQTETDLFWKSNIKRIMPWYIEQKNETDVIVSASPDFLLYIPYCQLKINILIATKMDKHNGKIYGRNCRGEEKVRRFRNIFPTETIEKFYSDSLSDKPMALISKKAYIVKHGHLREWKTKL